MSHVLLLFLLQGCAELVRTLDDASDDLDGDGWSVFAGDCDDYNHEIYPEAEEIAGDDVDSDCDGDADT
jgi:hypothetical protein